ncbi:hypothetical protein AMET1_1210 [Methanonatronarchaeum thermophilum]|uniref:Uncharacterized protein n=1 Tax=Methanonatronarchaeum thermophilum TaxID=1927129 RepID=A0A1Y3GA58_9EURY|nr:hypothetical protein AMET1_1210 [Methanonatronarchaeum thermophilum]
MTTKQKNFKANLNSRAPPTPKPTKKHPTNLKQKHHTTNQTHKKAIKTIYNANLKWG